MCLFLEGTGWCDYDISSGKLKFKCTSGDDVCIEMSWALDGDGDCADHSDERGYFVFKPEIISCLIVTQIQHRYNLKEGCSFGPIYQKIHLLM